MGSSAGLVARGLIVGFTIAAAVGPISLLTIRRTLAHGQLYGLVSGLGVATADATYAGIAAFGLTAISGLLVSGRLALGLIGGLIVIGLGLRTLLSHPGTEAVERDRPGLVQAYGSIYGLTMTNPMTILAFAALFAGFGFAVGAGSLLDAGTLTAAVWLGSALWWVVLTSIVASLRRRISGRGLLWINRLSGAALVGFGIVAIGAAVSVG